MCAAQHGQTLNHESPAYPGFQRTYDYINGQSIKASTTQLNLPLLYDIRYLTGLVEPRRKGLEHRKRDVVYE